MSAFDPYFELLRRYQSDLQSKGRTVHSSWVDSSGSEGGRPGLNTSEVILKENTAVELGGPRTVSSSFSLWTENISLLNSGRITLAGPDIPDIGRELIPFGRVVLVAGRELSDSIQPKLDSKLAAAEQLFGYMVRSTGGNIWARVSHEALEDAFSLYKLGANIVNHLRTAIPTVEAIEVLFVTSSDEDVTELERIGAQVRKLSHDLRRRRIKDLGGGEYECEKDISCEACPENDVCSEIRQVLRLQKKKVSQ
ncbi:MAG: hypothetical protein JSW38_08610 [Dehalococcoidia bacterium]|nr:MAG: hypothetical protein JSW38_08610 [Dehalococcoidia bacterium]